MKSSLDRIESEVSPNQLDNTNENEVYQLLSEVRVEDKEAVIDLIKSPTTLQQYYEVAWGFDHSRTRTKIEEIKDSIFKKI
jgi:hypothetical protein